MIAHTLVCLEESEELVDACCVGGLGLSGLCGGATVTFDVDGGLGTEEGELREPWAVLTDVVRGAEEEPEPPEVPRGIPRSSWK
jgi:hypothetical protein